MKKIVFCICWVLLSFPIHSLAQSSLDQILNDIKKNNTTLIALRKQIDAEILLNKTEILPNNPETEFSYLFGNPSSLSNRTDFSFRQSFDFPTSYLHKKKISDIKNVQLEIAYDKAIKEIVFQATNICIEITFFNELLLELQKRALFAEKWTQIYKNKWESGDINTIEYNKVHLFQITVQNEIKIWEGKRAVIIADLIRLNGGVSIPCDNLFYHYNAQWSDFQSLFTQFESQNPDLQWMLQEKKLVEKQKKLAKAQYLPAFFVGYMSESVVNQNYRGVTAGVTIPLWEKRNTVKWANAYLSAVESKETDLKLQYYLKMKPLFESVLSQINNIEQFKNDLILYNNEHLLLKAFELGEISLSEFLFESNLVYDNNLKLIEMNKELSLAIADLYKYF